VIKEFLVVFAARFLCCAALLALCVGFGYLLYARPLLGGVVFFMFVMILISAAWAYSDMLG
jgi:hypothetical protein